MSQDNTLPKIGERTADLTLSAVYRQIADFYDEAFALEEIARLAFRDCDAARLALRQFRGSGSLDFLEVVVSAFIMQSVSDELHRETDIRARFYAELSDYLPGASPTIVKYIEGNIPDGFVQIGGLTAPVEIKRHAFDEKAVAQLTRYMKVYGSELGIAVAPALTCGLPEAIRFVEVLPPPRRFGSAA